MRFSALRASVLISLFSGLCLCATSVLAINNSPEAQQARAALNVKASGGKLVRVIVTVKEPAAKTQAFGLAAAAADRSAGIAGVHQKLLANFPVFANRASTKLFKYTPHMAVEVSAAELQGLINDPEVVDIVEDHINKASLVDSVPLIGAPNVWSGGNIGGGQAVAILDTGVDKAHPFFGGRVVAEGCSSSTSSAGGYSSLCPGGVANSVAAGSGVNCDTSLIGGCFHGTHVAGIAAGQGGGSTGVTFSGVAKGTGIVAIQVFTKFTTTADCVPYAPPCLGAFNSDILWGLQRVYDLALQGSIKIASVNMSLGGGGYTTSCDTSPLKSAIDNLKSLGVATVIASGNSGYTNAISSPACISSAISVGATSKQDVVASYSNSSTLLKLLAPGSEILSSYPGNQYRSDNGTSMAAPHVAGGFALLKARKPTATVDELFGVLNTTGVPVTDARNGISRPRIQLDTAVNFLVKPISVTKVNGDVSNQAHTINWGNAADGLGLSGFTLTVDGTSYNLGNSTTSYQINLTPNVNHAISVVARDPRGHTSAPVSKSYSYDTLAPSQPASVSAVKLSPSTSSTSTRISWGASTDAVGVTAYRLKVDGVQKALALVTQFDTSLSINVNHTIAVTALDAAGNESTAATMTFMPTDTVKPAVPTGLNATKGNNGYTKLSWQAATDDVGVSGYRIVIDGGAPVSVGNVTSTSLSLVRGVSHTINIAAVDAAGNQSALSTALVYTPPLDMTAVITYVSGTTSGATRLRNYTASNSTTPAGTSITSYSWQVTAGNATIPGNTTGRDVTVSASVPCSSGVQVRYDSTIQLIIRNSASGFSVTTYNQSLYSNQCP